MPRSARSAIAVLRLFASYLSCFSWPRCSPALAPQFVTACRSSLVSQSSFYCCSDDWRGRFPQHKRHRPTASIADRRLASLLQAIACQSSTSGSYHSFEYRPLVRSSRLGHRREYRRTRCLLCARWSCHRDALRHGRSPKARCPPPSGGSRIWSPTQTQAW